MRKISSKFIAIAVFLIIFGGIGATILADVWTAESTKIPVTFKEGAFAGQYNPADIRGSYTFQEVSDLFGVKLEDLFTAFGIAKGTDGTAVQTKILEEMYPNLTNEIGNGSVQLFVALYKGLPPEYGDTYLPSGAKDILYRQNPNLTAEEKAYIESHLVQLPTAEAAAEAAASGDAAKPAKSGSESGGVEPIIKGSTTFGQALDAGITKAQIEEIIGAEMPPTNALIKDYCLEKGLTFSEIKDALNALVA